MATTKLDTLILQFRRDIGDNFNSSTGVAIAAANEGGNVYSAVEIEDLVYRAIDEFMERAVQEIPVNMAIGRLLAQIIPEYLTTFTLATGTVSGKEITFALPDDFGYVVGVIYDGKRSYPVPREEWDSLIEGRNTERHRSPHFVIEGGSVVVHRHEPAPDVSDGGKISYIKRQTGVTQGGSTDIALNMRHKGRILQIMGIIHHRDLGATDA